jgi:phenylacetate-CoA ligase
MTADFSNAQASLKDLQLSKLRKLLAAQSDNKFYRTVLEPITGNTTLESLEAFIANVPFTDKQQLMSDQLLHPPYGTNLACPFDQYKRMHQTSGTTATPLRWLDTDQSWQAILNCWRRIYQAAGVTAEDSICFTFSFGPFLGFWSAFEAATQHGCVVLPTGGMSSQARIQLILETQATVLCCTPSYALRLAEVAKADKLPIETSNIQRIIAAGEPGGSIPATRALIEQSWNARVYDHHGMTETGPISYPCAIQKDTLHVDEDSFFVEILDPEDQHAIDNKQDGELVITTLDRHGSPLLRYRTGDLVQAAQGLCPCGSPHLTLVGGIRGRRDDMVIIRGVNVHPSAIEEVVRHYAAAAEYRVIVDQCSSMSEIQLEIELESDANTTDILNNVRQAIKMSMNLNCQIQQIPIGSLPRQDMKAKRWSFRKHGSLS